MIAFIRVHTGRESLLVKALQLLTAEFSLQPEGRQTWTNILNAAESCGETPLLVCASLGLVEAAEAVLLAGASLQAQYSGGKHKGCSAFVIACMRADNAMMQSLSASICVSPDKVDLDDVQLVSALLRSTTRLSVRQLRTAFNLLAQTGTPQRLLLSHQHEKH